MKLQVNKLIDKAYQVIGIKSADRNLTGDEITEGLEQLNIIIDLISGNSQQISFSKTLTFDLTIGKQVYTIGEGGDFGNERLVNLEKAVLIDSNIQYPLSILSDNAFYGISRNLNTNGKPSRVFFQNNLDNLTEIHFFIIPDKSYTVKIKGKFILSNLEFNTEIENVPHYYYAYLQYYLAKVLHSFFPSSTWTPENEKFFTTFKSECLSYNDIDLDVRTSPIRSADGNGG